MPRKVKHLGDRLIEDFFNAGESWKQNITQDHVELDELEEGIRVEEEHSRDPVMMMKIALDHLAEHRYGKDDFNRYYTGLSILEQVLKSGNLDELIRWAGGFGFEPTLRRAKAADRKVLGLPA